MEISVQHAGRITIVEIKGRLDSNTAKAFAERLTSLINAGQMRLVVDFKHIEYIASAGFRALLVADQLAKSINGTVALCSLSADVYGLFEIGAFTSLFPIYATRGEAVAKLSAQHVVDIWVERSKH